MQHADLKGSRHSKRTSRNVPKTLMQQDERLNVYNLTNNLLVNKMVKNIKNVFSDVAVEQYERTAKVFGGKMYECSKLVIHGTEYFKDQFILLPDSTNSHPNFGRLVKLLCDEKFGYFLYEETKNYYCYDTDLFMVKKKKEKSIIRAEHIASYLPLDSYEVGEKKAVSISLRHNILEHL